MQQKSTAFFLKVHVATKKKKKLLGAGVGGYTEEYSYLYGDAWSHKAPQVQLYHFSTTKINTITYRAQCLCFSEHLGMLLKSYLLHHQQILHRDGDRISPKPLGDAAA